VKGIPWGTIRLYEKAGRKILSEGLRRKEGITLSRGGYKHEEKGLLEGSRETSGGGFPQTSIGKNGNLF